MDEEGIARFVREENIGLVGIGAMTRMIAKAYRMADAVRAAGVPVVMGGPHRVSQKGQVTKLRDFAAAVGCSVNLDTSPAFCAVKILGPCFPSHAALPVLRCS